MPSYKKKLKKITEENNYFAVIDPYVNCTDTVCSESNG
jgi:hypothetical protein